MKMVRFAHEISLFAYFYVEDHFRFSHFRGYAAMFVPKALILCAEHAYSVAQIVAYNDSEEAYHEGSYDSTNAFNALHPYEVVEAHGVESRPYTVTEVEPQSN